MNRLPAASEQEQSQVYLNSAEREQALYDLKDKRVMVLDEFDIHSAK